MLDHKVRANSEAQERSCLLVIQESSVLLRVEHLEESAGRITVDSLTNLVDFVDEDQRVLDSYALECLDDLPGQGPVDM